VNGLHAAVRRFLSQDTGDIKWTGAEHLYQVEVTRRIAHDDVRGAAETTFDLCRPFIYVNVEKYRFEIRIGEFDPGLPTFPLRLHSRRVAAARRFCSGFN